MNGKVQSYIPEIAIIEPNTLSALGLRIILEELIPHSVIRTFPSFSAFIDDTPDMYAHYFVSAQLYFEHTSFFLERKPKSIILTTGAQPLPPQMPYLDVLLPQEQLIKAIMRLRNQEHARQGNAAGKETEENNHELSPREIEVLILITKGFINKEIAQKLSISLTTVISHRKNIMEKLGIKSVAGLAIYAVMHGFIEADSI